MDCVAGMDYSAPALVFKVTIYAGSISSSFDMNIIDDVTDEDHETFSITIKLLPSCLSLDGGISSATVTIIDDDGMYVMCVCVLYTIMVACCETFLE